MKFVGCNSLIVKRHVGKPHWKYFGIQAELMTNSCQVTIWQRINFLPSLSHSKSSFPGSSTSQRLREGGTERHMMRGKKGKGQKKSQILYLWSLGESYVKPDTTQKSSTPVQCLGQPGKAAYCPPTTSRKRFAFVSPSEVGTEAAITKGLHGYVIGYWKRVFATKQRRRYLICLKTKAYILSESTAQSVWSPNSPNPSVLPPV